MALAQSQGEIRAKLEEIRVAVSKAKGKKMAELGSLNAKLNDILHKMGTLESRFSHLLGILQETDMPPASQTIFAVESLEKESTRLLLESLELLPGK